MYQTLAFLKHYLLSLKLHGIHSPFVYDLVTKCIQPKNTQAQTLHKLDVINKKWKHFQNSQIPIFFSNHTTITPSKQHLLLRLSHYFNFQKTIELGTSMGKVTLVFALSENNHHTNIDTCTQTSQITQSFIKTTAYKNRVSFTQNIPKNNTYLKADCIFINSQLNPMDIYTNFEKILHLLHNDSLLILNDPHKSKEKHQIWKKISKHPQVTVTVDLFQLGLVFFRKQQLQEKFYVKL